MRSFFPYELDELFLEFVASERCEYVCLSTAAMSEKGREEKRREKSGRGGGREVVAVVAEKIEMGWQIVE
jgi:hypothetical protein